MRQVASHGSSDVPARCVNTAIAGFSQGPLRRGSLPAALVAWLDLGRSNRQGLRHSSLA